jgi:predicted short-subunit dehydrogenase-like oxidoreductase (DUF2520 family)
MNIVILGSGNAATVLGRKFKAVGHTILQIYSRNAAAATELAYEWDSESTNYKSTIIKTADVYIIAVNDNAIDDVTDNLLLPGRVVAHTAAAVSKEVLKNVTNHYGVFYPLQSLRKEMTTLPDVPIFFEGSDEKTKTVLAALAVSISPAHATEGSGDLRQKLHVAAVVVSNFTNHLYTLAEAYCKNEGSDFAELLPLIQETANRLISTSPAMAQTGPAIRHDSETIQKHLELLKNHPQLKNIYVLLTESIQQGKISN